MIDYIKLEKYLKSLTYKDFVNIKMDSSIVKEAHTVDEILRFGYSGKIEKGSIVNYGEYFLVDVLGNDLTVVKLTRRKYKTPKGRMVKAKIIKTIIDDCKKQYGSCINGYFHIPKDCYIGVKNEVV